MEPDHQPTEPTKHTSRLGWASLLGMGVSSLLTLVFFCIWFVYVIKYQPRGPGIPQTDDRVAPVLGAIVFGSILLQLVSGGLGIGALFQRGTRKIAPGFSAGCGCLVFLGLALFMLFVYYFGGL